MVRKSKANWWLVFALLPLMLALLVGEALLPESPFEHRVLEVGIVLVTFGLISLWVHVNEDALVAEEYAAHRWIVTAVSTEEARGVESLPRAECSEDFEAEGREDTALATARRDR